MSGAEEEKALASSVGGGGGDATLKKERARKCSLSVCVLRRKEGSDKGGWEREEEERDTQSQKASLHPGIKSLSEGGRAKSARRHHRATAFIFRAPKGGLLLGG